MRTRLVIAGATAGVLDATGHTIATLDATGVDDLVSSGTATAGMIAKLRACRAAVEGGVADVLDCRRAEPRRARTLLTGQCAAERARRTSDAK